MKRIGIFSSFLLSCFFFFLPAPVLAAFTEGDGCTQKPLGPNGQPILDASGKPIADVPSLACLSQVVVNIINVLLGLLAGVTLIFLLIGILKLVVSRGDPKALDGAKKTITYAFLGFFLVFFSTLLINFLTKSLGLPSLLNNFTLYQGSQP